MIIKKIRKILYIIWHFVVKEKEYPVITNIFDYNEVIKNRFDLDKNVMFSNHFYGYSYTMKKYSGYKKTIKTPMEHAPALESDDMLEYKIEDAVSLIVNSKQRVDYLKKKITKPIWAIGPSVYYSESIFDEFDVEAIKEQFGKTLLVYPLHDIEDDHYIQDTEQFIRYIKDIKKRYNYKTVIVSMFFVDIERGRHFAYLDEGWRILSAGRRENYDFNIIMKSIIQLADYAIFQAYASAIGYCIYYDVPVTIYHQDVLFKERDKQGYGTDNGMKNDTMSQFEKMFSEYNEIISEEQRKFCEYWYGYLDIRTPEEIKLLFDYVSRLSVNMSKEQMKKIAMKKKYERVSEWLLSGIE